MTKQQTATHPADPDILIVVTSKSLSDGSMVFDVAIGNVSLAAVTEHDATELAEKVREAIEDHTVSAVGVIYEA